MEKNIIDTKFDSQYECEEIADALSSDDYSVILETLMTSIAISCEVLENKLANKIPAEIKKQDFSITKALYLMFMLSNYKFKPVVIENLKNIYFIILGKSTYHTDLSSLGNRDDTCAVPNGKTLNLENIHIFTIESELQTLFKELSLKEIKYIICFFYNLTAYSKF